MVIFKSRGLAAAGAKAQSDPQGAAAAFDAVAGDAAIDPLLRDAARLRAAPLRVDIPAKSKKGAAALTSLSAADGPFRRLAELALAALALARNDYDDAAKQFDLVLGDPEVRRTSGKSASRWLGLVAANRHRRRSSFRRRSGRRFEAIMSAKVAIIGRPNVGKSTLFNRLVGRRLALVDDEPGVTRDRREGEARLADLAFTIVDTAGSRRAIRTRLSGACARRRKPRSWIATRSCSWSTRAPASPRPIGILRKACAAPASRSSSSPTRPRAARGATAFTRPSVSASASRSPCPPSTARA